MDSRRSLALKFYLSYTEATGVVNYFINLIRALNMLPDKDMPHILIVCSDKAPVEDVRAINYPHISFFFLKDLKGLNFVQRVVNKLFRTILKRNVFRRMFHGAKADVFLDHYYTEDFPIRYSKRLCWICDFQHRYFPDFFSVESYRWNEEAIRKIIESQDAVLLSSHDAERDYNKFYYFHKSEIRVLQFASILPTDFYRADFLSPYADKKFFIVANQFWPHKNHLTVVRAVAELKKEGIEVLLLCTGHMSDRDPNYAGSVRSLIDHFNLHDNIIFLGFLDRIEQLNLIARSIAVIQPSLFEGWSTVVEDCKAVGVPVILSDLRVNFEQINSNCYFFRRLEFSELTSIMRDLWLGEPTERDVYNLDYARDFAHRITKVLDLT